MPPADHLWTNVCTRARDDGRRPELRITGAAAQTRMVSVARIRLVSRKSPRLFKGIICDDISEFESHMPSHAVRSLWLIYGTSKNVRHSTRLARLKRARPRAGAWRSPERSAPFRDRRRICWGCVAHRGPGRVVLKSWGGRPVLHSRCSRLVLKTFTDHTLRAHCRCLIGTGALVQW